MPWAERTSDEAVGVGRYVQVRVVGDVVVIFAAGMPVRRLSRREPLALRVELAHLQALDLVSQADVARSGLVPEATFHRDCRAFAQGGDQALRARAHSGPTKLVADVLTEVRRLHAAGESNVAVGAKLGMSESSVRRALRQIGVDSTSTGAVGAQELPLESGATQHEAASEASPASDGYTEAETDVPAATAEVHGDSSAPSDAPPTVAGEAEFAAIEAAIASDSVDATALAKSIAAQRTTEIFMARAGLIEEQSALFPPQQQVRYAGVLLGLALLTVTGLLEETRRCIGRLPNGLYGIRSIVTALVAMALLRCKRPEQLKGFDPTNLGAVLGLARAPEMKTLRRKMRSLAADEQAVKALVHGMAKRHVDRAKDAVGFLYVDGHVRPYFGDKELSKAHHTAMRISLPATTDYWVGDANGAPVLVMITEGNSAMTKTMPALLDEVRRVVGPTARPTVVFDRGGYSAALFRLVLARDYDFITYRKGKQRPVPRTRFVEMTIRRAGQDRKVLVHDGRIQLNGFGRIRCVAVLRPDGKQTHVLTSRKDLSTREVLERMFSRWQQENFFKYLDEQYAFDALWTYRATSADPQRTVPNPLRKKLDRQIGELRREVAKRTQKLGDLARVARPFDGESKQAELAQQIDAAREIAEIEASVATLRARRKELPLRVPVGSIREDGVFELARAPMLLADVMKMTAFHIETMLVAAMGTSLKRADDEGRAVIADFMQLDGRFEALGDVLRVTLRMPSAPRYVVALRALCTHVNALNPTFPETRTRLEFFVDEQGIG